MKKTISIQLYGGPGTGKSTTAADVFVQLKKAKVDCELVQEYIKGWVWEERTIKPTDQIYILAKQARKEQVLFKKVDVVVSDSPLWLIPIYEKKYAMEPYITQQIVDKFKIEAEQHGVQFIHVFLNRVKEYNPNGRHQTEEEAKLIDLEIKKHLESLNLPFFSVDSDESAATEILKRIGLLKEG